MAIRWLHISDALRAIEAATRVGEYSVINVGHPDVVPIRRLAEMVCDAVGADRSLLREVDLPEKMTLGKNPSLVRQTELLGVIPEVTLDQGVHLVSERVRARVDLADASQCRR